MGSVFLPADLDFLYAAEEIGALVIPVSAGVTERQIKSCRITARLVLCGTPSYALYISEVAEEMGIDFENLKLKLGFLGAEPWSESMRAEDRKKTAYQSLNSYGSVKS
jgi:phenylacetate-CoA ligase